MVSTELQTIREWLAGVYSNRQQAMDQPVWFIPVRLWYIPVQGLFSEGMGFFTEQVNEHTPDQPYRSRVLHLTDHEGPLRFENYRFRDQQAWAGATRAPERLADLSTRVLEHLPGCTIYLESKVNSFSAKMTGRGCRLSAESSSYVEISFELTPTAFVTLDRGFDLTSGEQVWGSRAGAYHYVKLNTLPVVKMASMRP